MERTFEYTTPDMPNGLKLCITSKAQTYKELTTDLKKHPYVPYDYFIVVKDENDRWWPIADRSKAIPTTNDIVSIMLIDKEHKTRDPYTVQGPWGPVDL